MIEFQLFRVHIDYPIQTNLFIGNGLPHVEILKNILAEKLEYKSIRNREWHLGNIINISDDAYYFRIGRITRSTLEFYKEGNFVDAEFDTSPYTHVFFDLKLEVIGIAKKVQLSPNIKGISNQVARLFNSSKYVLSNNLEISIKEITDPTNFINYLQTAFAVKKFMAIIPSQNAFDPDTDFTKPFPKTIKESNALKGKTELIGENLNPSILEPITRTIASLGSDASALIQENSESKPIKKSLKGNVVTLSLSDVEIEENKKDGIKKIRIRYAEIKKQQ